MVNKKGISVRGVIIALIILIALFVLISISYSIITGKGSAMFENLKNLLRFGGSK